MDYIWIIQLITFVLCILNYLSVLYINKWDLANTNAVGWLMACLGWGNVIF